MNDTTTTADRPVNRLCGGFVTVRLPRGEVTLLASRGPGALLGVCDSSDRRGSYVPCTDGEALAAAEARLARLRQLDAGAEQTADELRGSMGAALAGRLSGAIAFHEAWLAQARREGLVRCVTCGGRSVVILTAGHLEPLRP